MALSSDEKDYLCNWLAKADEGVAVIESLINDHPELYTGAICFHCHQAVEKYLKGQGVG